MAFQYVTRKVYNVDDMVIGDDWREFIPIYQKGGVLAWDFTGWQAHAQVRDKDGGLVCEFNSDQSTPTIEFADNGMYLIKPLAETAELDAENCTWSCRFTDDDGNLRSQILKSQFAIVLGCVT